jgi:hypothetical protein
MPTRYAKTQVALLENTYAVRLVQVKPSEWAGDAMTAVAPTAAQEGTHRRVFQWDAKLSIHGGRF